MSNIHQMPDGSRVPFSQEEEDALIPIRRQSLRDKIATDYDAFVDAGITVTVTGAGELTILPRDVTLISGALSTFATAVNLGAAQADGQVFGEYTFPEATVALSAAQCLQLGATYQATRSARYQAHNRAKTAVVAGNIPTEADIAACGLVEADFVGRELEAI